MKKLAISRSMLVRAINKAKADREVISRVRENISLKNAFEGKDIKSDILFKRGLQRGYQILKFEKALKKPKRKFLFNFLSK